MRKGITVLLVLAMVVTLMPVCAFARSEDTLTVQTRSSEYVFHVGDTFTYSYWLSLKPDVVNYSEDYLRKLMAVSFGGKDKLSGLKLSNLNDLTLKSVIGSIKFDTDCLALTEADMPNINLGIVKQKSDVADGTLIDGTVLDFSNADIFFWSNIMTKSEKSAFKSPKVLVSCRFKVLKGSNTPVYLRTKLTKLEVTTQTIGTLVDKRDIKLVDKRTTYFPYESFETVNNEKPTIVLKSLVDDVGLDIRYLNTSLDKSQFRRPGAGITVRMMGFSSDARYEKLEKQSDGTDVLWFYDVPYGQYYVDCSFSDAQGRFFATPDPEKAEHINVPATGEVQALWLVEAVPSETKQINVYVNWVGDEGYLPVRPEYLYLQLYNEQDAAGLFLNQQIIPCTDTHTSFNSVAVNDRTGKPVEYKLVVSAQGGGFAPYSFEIKKISGDFYVTATYYGDEDELWKIPIDAGEHCWVVTEKIKPGCELEGRVCYVCDECHETKDVRIPATGHNPAVLPGKAAGCTTYGETEGSCCTTCGKILKPQTSITPKGHCYKAVVTAPTCTAKGYTTYTCSCGDRYRGNYVDALGHKTEIKNAKDATCNAEGYTGDKVCTACGKMIEQGKTVAKLGHSYTKKVVKPTASKQGYTQYTCSVCGYSYKTSYTIAAPTVKLSNVASTGKIKLSWGKIAGADKYYIYRSTDGGKTYKFYASTTNTSYTNTGTTAGKTYYYKVKAVKIRDDKKTYSAYSTVHYLTCDLARPVVKIATSKGDPKLTWSKISGATKYEVYRATSKSGTYSKMITTSKTSYTNTSAKAGKTYYYKVKAVCGTSAAASAYSTVVSIKAK